MARYVFFDFDGVIVDSFDWGYEQFSSFYHASEDDYRNLFVGNFFACLEAS